MSRLRKAASENEINANIESFNKIKSLLSQLADETEMLEYSIDKMQLDNSKNSEEVKNAIKELKNISFNAMEGSEKMDKFIYPTLTNLFDDIVIKNQQDY